MNQIDEEKIIEEAKRKFIKHKWLYVRVKKDASVPYEKSFFHKIIADSNNPKLMHKQYILYIHEQYLTIRAQNFIFETIKHPLDDKIWVELNSVFSVKEVSDDQKLMQDKDVEPI